MNGMNEIEEFDLIWSKNWIILVVTVHCLCFISRPLTDNQSIPMAFPRPDPTNTLSKRERERESTSFYGTIIDAFYLLTA